MQNAGGTIATPQSFPLTIERETTMLWSLDHLRSFSLHATDGSLGSVSDVLFDDMTWTVRWVVVDTAWLFGRHVLLATSSFGHPVEAAKEIPVDLTQEKIKDAPGIDMDRPVERQHEADLYSYYGWAPYWGIDAFGMAPLPPMVPPPGDPIPEAERGDPHLRSGHEVKGYAIHASDDTIGSVDDLLVDEAGWVVRYVVVDTGNWLPGRKVLISPRWVQAISWEDREVRVNLTRAQIEGSPEYDPDAPLGREYEDALHRHYGSTGYWA